MSQNRFKIAVVVPKFGLVGGAEGFAAELTARIAENPEYEVHVFAQRWQGDFSGITFHRVPVLTFPRCLTTLSFANFVRKQLEKENFHLIHTHERILSADLFTMHGIPHRMWVNNVRMKRPSLFDLVTQRVERKLVREGSVKRFLAVSSLVKERFLEEYDFIASEQVQIVHPGVVWERFRDLDKSLCRAELTKTEGLDNNSTFFLFVSMNFHIKGLDRVLSGLARFKSKNPSEKFTLIVVGRDRERKYRSLAENLGVGQHVLFTGLVHKDPLARIYRASDVFVMPSRFDTFGIAALEAMAASLPVVIGRNVGAKDLVKDGLNGWILKDDENPDEMAEKFHRLCDEQMRTKMGTEAFATAQCFTWEKSAEKIQQIYKLLLKTREH